VSAPQVQNPAGTGPGKEIHLHAWVILCGLGLFNVIRGAYHWLSPDSGAASVAGFDLSSNGAAIIYLLAVAGVAQLAFGLLDIYVAWSERRAVALMLALESLKSAMLLLTDYWIKPPGVPIPGRYAHWAVLIVSLLTLIVCAPTNDHAYGTRR
jgi:hypothetical protein